MTFDPCAALTADGAEYSLRVALQHGSRTTIARDHRALAAAGGGIVAHVR